MRKNEKNKEKFIIKKEAINTPPADVLMNPCDPEYYDYYDDTSYYYAKIFAKIKADLFLLIELKKDLSEQNIIRFNLWFIQKFGNDFSKNNPEVIYKIWNKEQVLYLLNMCIQHLNDDYSIHEIGGCTLNFIENFNFLSNIARGIRNFNWSVYFTLIKTSKDDLKI